MKDLTLIISPECFSKISDYRDLRVKRGTCIGTFAPCIHETKKAYTISQAFQILGEWVMKGYSCEILARELPHSEDDSGTWDVLCYTKFVIRND